MYSMESKREKGNALSPLSSLIQSAVEKAKATAETKKRHYTLSLNPEIVEALREKGFKISPLVEHLLAETLIQLSGSDRLQILFQFNPTFRELLKFAKMHESRWEDPQRKEWWDNWFRKIAQEFGVGAEELRKFCQG
jgi:hypothetical protein